MSLAKIQNAMQEMNLIASNMESMIKLATYLARDGWTAQSLVSAYLSYGIKYSWTWQRSSTICTTSKANRRFKFTRCSAWY